MTDIFLGFLNRSLAAGILILAVVLVRLVFKKAPRWLLCALWALAAVRLVCPVSIESVLSLIPSAEPVQPEIIVSAQPAITSGIPAVDAIVNPPLAAAFTPSPAQSANPLHIWTFVAACVWLAGIAALLLYAAVSALRLRLRVRTAVRLEGKVYQSEFVSSPFILGVIRPRIYLPFGLEAGAQAMVLAHERAHLRRGDQLWKPLGYLILTAYWFNPVCWLAYILFCRDVEAACDEKVVRELGEGCKAAYSRALLACSVPRKLITACPLAFGETGVKARIRSVLNYKKPAFWLVLAAVIASVAVAVCFLTDPVDSKTEEPADTIVSNTENTPDSADTTLEESSQPTVPSEPEQPTEQDVLKGALSAAEEADTSILDELISNAVLDHYADAVQPGQIHVESHVTLAEDKHDTQSVTVYLLVLQEIYSVDGESLTLENGSYIPTAITFSLSTSGGAPIEYWEPSDGSYSDDIRAKFPAAAADEALNDQAYIDALRSACEEQAQKARTSTQG